MAGPFSQQRIRQPLTIPRLDASNPLTKGLVFCAVPFGLTFIDLVTGAVGTRTGALTSRLWPHAGGFSRTDPGVVAVTTTGGAASTDQVVWPVSTTLRGGTAVQTGTLLCLGGIAESVATKEYFFGASRDNTGDGPGLRLATGVVGPGQAGAIMRSRSSSTAIGSGPSGMLGSSTTTGLRTHFFGYSYNANGVNGTWLGARTGSNWTSGTAFGTGNTSRKAMLFTDYDANTYTTKSGYIALFLIYDRQITLAEYQALYDNPWQLFQPAEIASLPALFAPPPAGADFTHAASGGLQFGGAATTAASADFSASAAGGLQFAGAVSADFTRAFAQAATGGLQFAGAAPTDFTRVFSYAAAGGLQTAGAATTTFTFNYVQAATGGLQYDGAATTVYTTVFAVAAAGGLQLGGSAGATAGVEFLATSSGGFQLNGAASADFTRAFVQVAAGGLQLAGSAATAATASYSVASSGGLQFGGLASATAGVEFLATASGGLQVGGATSAAFTRDFQQAAAGGLVLGGHAVSEVSQGFAVLGSGGIFFAGAAAATYSAGYLATASGGLRFGGSALIESSNEPAIFPPVSRRIATSQARRVVAGGQRIVRG